MQDFPSELQTLLDISKTNFINITLTSKKSELIADCHSKVGGLGYLPMGEAYPVGKSGNPLAMLAQINFAEVAQSVALDKLPHPLPTTGILQFYIAWDNSPWGLDDSHPPVDEQGKDFQVRYWREIRDELNFNELAKAQAFLQSLGNKADDGEYRFLDKVRKFFQSWMANDSVYMPFDLNFEFLMSFEQQSQSCTANCYELDTFAPKIGKSIDWDYQDKVLDDYLKQANADEEKHQLLGYPSFCQDDPRSYNEELQEYILLLQLASERAPKGWKILWGDAGIANFFIHPDDLAKGDFSKVFYNWDCC